ncbi:beta-N-acetylhexosaminidase [Sarracenia purpurea var. burkii]
MATLVVQTLSIAFVLQILVASSAVDVKRVNIWPMPQSVSSGHQILYLSKEIELSTEGSKYPDVSGVLKDGFSRLIDLVRTAHAIDGNSSKLQKSVTLQGIRVLIFSPNDEVCIMY